MRSAATVFVLVVLLIVAAFAGIPAYNVYAARMAGEATYSRAMQDRRVRVLEAQARLDSARLEAQAEVELAKGTDSSNRIMAQSLGGPDNYLRWSYIHMLQETAGKGDRQVIYLPTEAGMPILEATRHIAGAAPAQ